MRVGGLFASDGRALDTIKDWDQATGLTLQAESLSQNRDLTRLHHRVFDILPPAPMNI